MANSKLLLSVVASYLVSSVAVYSQVSTPVSQSTDFFLYVGTYGKGVYAFRYNSQTSAAEPLGLQGEIENPSFITTDPQQKYVYAVSELNGDVNGGVGAFAIDRHTGSLKPLNTRSSEGQAPCHVSVDHTGKLLLVANYGTGQVTVFPIKDDGSLGSLSQTLPAEGSSVNKARQSGPHAHEAVWSPDNRFVYVPDLGRDVIRIYKLNADEQKLIPNNPAFAHLQPGHGPRHIAISADGKFAYVANELQPMVTAFSRDIETGGLTQIQELSILPENAKGDNAPAEIAIDPQGRFLYESNRGPGTIAVFSIAHENGTLKPVQVVETGGTWPRGFEFDPGGRHLIAGDEKLGKFVIFDVDPETGTLKRREKSFDVPSPVSFAFVPASPK